VAFQCAVVPVGWPDTSDSGLERARARHPGTVLLLIALFLSDSVDTLFRLFPMPVLGVILFFGASNWRRR